MLARAGGACAACPPTPQIAAASNHKQAAPLERFDAQPIILLVVVTSKPGGEIPRIPLIRVPTLRIPTFSSSPWPQPFCFEPLLGGRIATWCMHLGGAGRPAGRRRAHRSWYAGLNAKGQWPPCPGLPTRGRARRSRSGPSGHVFPDEARLARSDSDAEAENLGEGEFLRADEREAAEAAGFAGHRSGNRPAQVHG